MATTSPGTARVFIALTRPGVALTLLAVTLSGTLVAQSRPIFWSLTLLVLMSLMYGATRSIATTGNGIALTHLPSALQRPVAETLALLPAGEARMHLSNVVRLADATLAIPDRDFDHRADRDLRERVVELVEVCAEASRGLGRIEAAWPSGTVLPATHSDAIGAARATYVRQLQDATATLERLTLSVTQRDARESERISELAAEIRREIGTRERAIADLDRLLS
ncbi:MAG TPA: hypothetical protein VLE53_04570 [Gemmatimonadaceae bacterium]|nr:hypothetical protein [Gemmatimonadaceae bacterium]